MNMGILLSKLRLLIILNSSMYNGESLVDGATKGFLKLYPRVLLNGKFIIVSFKEIGKRVKSEQLKRIAVTVFLHIDEERREGRFRCPLRIGVLQRKASDT